MKDQCMLTRLINRGDQVEIKNGKLLITSSSGRAVPPDWLKAHKEQLIRQILEATQQQALTYTGHSVKDYKSEGFLTVQFECVTTQSCRYVIYNILRSRQRTTSHGKAGTKLPKRHFRTSPNSDLAKLWKRLPIKQPKLSSLHDYIGLWKDILFTGHTIKDTSEKLDKISLKPLSITSQTISEAVSNNTYCPDTNSTKDRQVTDNYRTSSLTSTPNEASSGEAYSESQLQENYYSKQLNSNTAIQRNVLVFPTHNNKQTYSEHIAAQTTDEWLADYEAAPRADEVNFPNDFGQKNTGNLRATKGN